VVQLSPPYSLSHFNDEESRIIGDALDYVGLLYGKPWESPEVTGLRRWKYSQPDTTAIFEAVNEPGATLIVAGDGVLAGRVEGAFACGLRAAALLVEEPESSAPAASGS
jgi:predicted NAD/FAD-dependent oxidoreductase